MKLKGVITFTENAGTGIKAKLSTTGRGGVGSPVFQGTLYVEWSENMDRLYQVGREVEVTITPKKLRK